MLQILKSSQQKVFYVLFTVIHLAKKSDSVIKFANLNIINYNENVILF